MTVRLLAALIGLAFLGLAVPCRRQAAHRQARGDRLRFRAGRGRDRDRHLRQTQHRCRKHRLRRCRPRAAGADRGQHRYRARLGARNVRDRQRRAGKSDRRDVWGAAQYVHHRVAEFADQGSFATQGQVDRGLRTRQPHRLGREGNLEPARLGPERREDRRARQHRRHDGAALFGQCRRFGRIPPRTPTSSKPKDALVSLSAWAKWCPNS